MVVLQTYQANLLRNLDHGEVFGPEAIQEPCQATDHTLQATKQTACAIGCSMVAVEWHLWLNLTGIKKKDKVFLLDTLISPFGLFGDAVNTVRYQEAKRQLVVFKDLIPHSAQEPTASTSHAHLGPSSVYSIILCARLSLGLSVGTYPAITSDAGGRGIRRAIRSFAHE